MSQETQFEGVGEHGAVNGLSPEYVEAEGISTRYYDEGSGEPLVLVHGGCWSASSSANVWSQVINPLSDEFRVLAFDRVGCGMSGNPDDPEKFNFRTEIDHVLAFIEEMGLDECHLAGSSWGGGVAARVAVEEPDLFKTLILTNSYAFNPRPGDRDHRAHRLYERASPSTDPVDPEYYRFRYGQSCFRTEHITDELLAANAYMRSTSKAERTAEVRASREAAIHDSRRDEVAEAHRRLEEGRLPIPVIYIYGRNDITVPLTSATGAFDLIAQRNPKVRLSVYAECGHLPQLEHPEEMSQELIDFVDRWY